MFQDGKPSWNEVSGELTRNYRDVRPGNRFQGKLDPLVISIVLSS
jgi:hypothetical protein